jgi:transglutaminase/protease-like cytokinesis protein 3
MLGVLLKLIISGFDPTWGSGFVNNGKFVNAFDDRYFKANPSEIIASHMPFDYMWQFLLIPFQIKSFIMEVLVLINQKSDLILKLKFQNIINHLN